MKKQTTMAKIPFKLIIHLPAEGLDEGSDVDFFQRGKTKANLFLFVTTPATNIPWISPAYFYDVHDGPRRFTPYQ